MEVSQLGNDDEDVPLMGTLEAKFLTDDEDIPLGAFLQQNGLTPAQVTKPQKKKKLQQQAQHQVGKPPLPQHPQNQKSQSVKPPSPNNNNHPVIVDEILLPKKKKKRKKKKKNNVDGSNGHASADKPLLTPTTPSSSKKKVSFSPQVVSNVGYTYSKNEYDRTPIMGIFNHFCNACMESIEGARFHCQLCPDFDMCQNCFVSQGTLHVHGAQAFTCPELDELDELENEGDEDDDAGYGNFFNQYFGGAFGDEIEADEGDDDSDLDDLAFQVVDDDTDVPLPQDTAPSERIQLTDEDGQALERISPEDAAALAEVAEEDTPIKVLFGSKPKPSSSPTVSPPTVSEEKAQGQQTATPLTSPKKKHKKAPPTQPAMPKKAKVKSEFSQPKTEPERIFQKHAATTFQPQKPKKKRKRKITQPAPIEDDGEEDVPLRVFTSTNLGSIQRKTQGPTKILGKRDLDAQEVEILAPQHKPTNKAQTTNSDKPKKRHLASGFVTKKKKQKVSGQSPELSSDAYVNMVGAAS